MRNLCYLSALVVLAGCGLSEEKFWPKFESTYCDAWDACHTGDGECPYLQTQPESGCEFDPNKARACLKGEYVCEDEFGIGAEFVEPPAECLQLYICETTTPPTAPEDTGTVVESR